MIMRNLRYRAGRHRPERSAIKRAIAVNAMGDF